MSESRQVEAVQKNSASSAAFSAGVSLLLILGFTLLTALGALLYIPVPGTPVPITLQTLMVLLAGAMIGGTRGSISQALYALWGGAGIPLFASGVAGFAVLAGPTGGYIMGFVIAAAFVGVMMPRAKNIWAEVAVFTGGTLLILLAGAFHLTIMFTGGDFGRALVIGVLPFLPGGALKVAAATGIWRAWTALRRGRNA
jgi:biotin transport system substrate-specific component